jgi:competence protein ComEC
MIPQPTSVPPGFSRKAPRQPRLWAAAAYSAGIILGVHAWRPASWWIVAVCVFAVSAAWLVGRRCWIGWILALSTFLLAGALHVQIRPPSQREDARVLKFANRQPLQLTAHVIKDGQIGEGLPGESRQTLDVETEELSTEESSEIPIHSQLRLGIYSSSANLREQGFHGATSMRIFRYGERIRCIARLRRPRNFRNPGAFDYEGYLAERGIVGLGSAKLEDVEVLPGFVGNRIERLRSRLHRSVVAKVHELWRADYAALIDAMIIGEDAFIDRSTRTDFQRSGNVPRISGIRNERQHPGICGVPDFASPTCH